MFSGFSEGAGEQEQEKEQEQDDASPCAVIDHVCVLGATADLLVEDVCSSHEGDEADHAADDDADHLDAADHAAGVDEAQCAQVLSSQESSPPPAETGERMPVRISMVGSCASQCV